MWAIVWVVLGIYFWLNGYYRAGFSEEDGSSISKAFVRPPLMIFLLCGTPTASNIPKGVIAFRSLMAQLQGILFTAYGVVYSFLSNHDLSAHMMILFFVWLVVLWFSWWLYKRYPYPLDKV